MSVEAEGQGVAKVLPCLILMLTWTQELLLIGSLCQTLWVANGSREEKVKALSFLSSMGLWGLFLFASSSSPLEWGKDSGSLVLPSFSLDISCGSKQEGQSKGSGIFRPGFKPNLCYSQTVSPQGPLSHPRTYKTGTKAHTRPHKYQKQNSKLRHMDTMFGISYYFSKHRAGDQ